MSVPTLILSNGVQLPVLSIGTAPISSDPGTVASNPKYCGFFPERVYRSLHIALACGMRHIDTALVYRSHRPVSHVLGNWLMEGRLQREDVFLTSKIYHPPVPNFATDDSTLDMDNMSIDQLVSAVREQFQRSLSSLNVGYVDMMLLHWPSPSSGELVGDDHTTRDGDTSMDAPVHAKIDDVKRKKRIAVWKVLEEFYAIGWARAIGVSNFSHVHLSHLKEDGATITPMVNQLETSLFIQHDSIIKYCKEHEIVVQAFSPFGRGVMSLLEEPELVSIASKHKKTPGQIALRFLIQKGFAATFYSSSEDHIRSNMDIFDFALDSDDLTALSNLKRRDGSGTWGLPSPVSLP